MIQFASRSPFKMHDFTVNTVSTVLGSIDNTSLFCFARLCVPGLALRTLSARFSLPTFSSSMLRALVCAELSLENLERALFLANLQQLHASLLVRSVASNLPNDGAHERNALVELPLAVRRLRLQLALCELTAFVHADAQVGPLLGHRVARKAQDACSGRHGCRADLVF